MKIRNQTVWRTDHLKAILQKAAEIELEPAKRKQLIVTVSYTRGGNSSGCAYIKGRHATVRIRHPFSRAGGGRRFLHVPDSDPRPSEGRWSKPDPTVEGGILTGKVVSDTSPRKPMSPEARKELVLHFASVAVHEYAHIRGMHHHNMPARYKWHGRWREYVSWASEFPLEVQVPKGKVKPTVDAKLEHVLRMLKLAQTREKRATTIVRKWKARERYYLKAMAATKPETTNGKTETEAGRTDATRDSTVLGEG